MRKSQPIKSSLFNMTAVLTVIAVLSALVLGYTHKITAGPIAEAKKQRELEAISRVVYDDFDNNPFEERMLISAPHDPTQKFELFPARKNGVITSVAIKTFSDKAFGGRLEMIVGLFLDGSVNSYEITDQKETPGLGTKVGEDKFKEQFHGLNPQRPFFKVRQDGGEIDAVTAATISSRAVIDAIKKANDAYNNFSNTGR